MGAVSWWDWYRFYYSMLMVLLPRIVSLEELILRSRGFPFSILNYPMMKMDGLVRMLKT